MNIDSRIHILTCIFDELQSTTSLTEKRNIVEEIPTELKEDFDFCIECLNGLHKFGYKYRYCEMTGIYPCPEVWTVKQVLEYLLKPMKNKDLTEHNINMHIASTWPWASFFEPIVNRELKLGIGKSILPKDGLSAMLAKKYEGSVRPSQGGYYITEKLDGNRCIARYDGERWRFTSRNGKEMHVNFDMTGLPKEFVYDGEILAPMQVEMSNDIYDYIVNDIDITKMYSNMFNSTSGMINRHDVNKKLVYNIFDIMLDDVTYKERRLALNTIHKDVKNDNVRILPVLAHFDTSTQLNNNITDILAKVVKQGGEGIMINLAGGLYTHKRTDQLLKYKEVYTMDMLVCDIQWGTGKYEGMVGALNCKITNSSGTTIKCDVGSGLTDTQRLRWAIHPEEIIGKIVEVAYFSISQASNMIGTEEYSLRFPRLKCVRNDKSSTSEH